MVSVIGSDIALPGLVADALDALGRAGIDMVAMQQQIRNVDVQFVVASKDFDEAVRVLHHRLVEDRDSEPTEAEIARVAA
jgi:aspartate kinase